MISDDAALAAGLGAVLGHLFPVWLGFKGGKGVATTLGTLLALAWPVGLIACAVWLVTALIFRMSSAAALDRDRSDTGRGLVHQWADPGGGGPGTGRFGLVQARSQYWPPAARHGTAHLLRRQSRSDVPTNGASCPTRSGSTGCGCGGRPNRFGHLFRPARPLWQRGCGHRGTAAPGGAQRTRRSPATVPHRRREIRQEIDRAARLGVRYIAACEPDFPNRAGRDRRCAGGYRGRPRLVSLFERPSVAIVGARNASLNGRRIAAQLARELSEAGFVIVSGLARGIDTEAHKAALESRHHRRRRRRNRRRLPA